MYRQNQSLFDLLQPVISAMGYELWGIEQLQRGSGSLLRIYIDKPDGVNISDCARASDQIAGLLDVNDPIRGAYELEVSSPGIERPLFTLEQFSRYLGHRVQIKLRNRIENRRNITGEIDAVTDGFITIGEGEEEFAIPVDMIDKAHLVEQV